MLISATYSPEDNKLRLSASSRLDAELYKRVRAAGFIWAPKQGIFVAPMWTPERADLAEELAGEIGDEDTSLVERAEERAGRFEDYSENRARDADQAHAAVKAIADNIPLGQPILIGHHSERHARKNAERIENGMRRAVKMWETSEYWAQRARGAIRAAKYKERPDVRARRIKTIEADKRKVERNKAEAERAIKLWENLHLPDSLKRKDGQPTTFLDRARYVAGHSNTTRYETYSALTAEPPRITPEQAQAETLELSRASISRCERWLAHYSNRLEYERAMLAEAGGTVADKVAPEVGGACQCWASPRGGWSYIQKVNKVSVTVLDNWGNGGRDFTRTIPFDKLSHIMSKEEVDAHRAAGELIEGADKTGGIGFVLRGGTEIKSTQGKAVKVSAPKPDQMREDMQAMKQSLAAGVKVVSAPQLFPTPPELAARMVELAQVDPDHRVLEPSAGTGNILKAIGAQPDKVAVEINPDLVRALARGGMPSGTQAHEADFLDWTDGEGFDRILMNPPFANGADIKHIEHALAMLKPGGRLVAICANGPRQQEKLKPIAIHWEDLPAGTFKEQETNVNTALLVIEKPDEDTVCPDGPLCPDPECQEERATRDAKHRSEIEAPHYRLSAQSQPKPAGIQTDLFGMKL